MIQLLRHRHMHRHLVPFQTPLMPQTSIHMGLSSLRGTPHLEQILEARPQGKSNDVNVCVWAPDLRHVWKGYQNKCTSFLQDRFQHHCNDCCQHEGADIFKEEVERLFFSAVWSTDYQYKQQAPGFFSIFCSYQLLSAVSILSVHALYFFYLCVRTKLSFTESRNDFGPSSIFLHPASSSLYLLESVQPFRSFCYTRQCKARTSVNKILQNLKCRHV